ncbi:stage V sporulation protein AA [Bacillus sp. AFS054943]|uniref:stage V sporulation protein AA n=1 Tax=Bacillus TaxID=1386 RepID=UPI000B4A1AAD|nr:MULTISPECIES: stage V sporulation protein AA [Bacillus]MDH4420245.1 stage V sporulation protein AA [Bacillus cereus]PER21378.1 stage V sporulation protein AA [Bacillus cereus]PFA64995.1 stage V sporulation protein AA [Bacillus sp. AFS015896]PGL87531.1 stage V sporulation protein AA [Bacillus sp. AFS054943]PGX09566.1 stage V sporulation protein AA [Bacillus sp. AFS033286]
MERTIYIKMRNRLKVSPSYEVKLRDIAQLAGDGLIVEALQNEIVYKITAHDKTHVVIDVMKIIEIIEKKAAHIQINLLGSGQTLVEIIYEKKKVHPVFFGLVWLLLFIGAALAIIYFHEDVSMQQVHQRLYYMITGEFKEQPLLFQVPYSVGLGLGMVLFFNHVFQKRINEEPSPLEVEMFQYQQSLDQYVIVNENKDNTKQLADD